MSLNKVMLIGNVGKDPVIRYVDSGVCTASFPLATTQRGYTLQNGTQVPDRTEWHNILAWRGIAETIEKYVRKGDKLYVEGELRTRSYTDKNGIVKYVTEVWLKDMEMLTPKSAKPTNGSAEAETTPASENKSKETAEETEDFPF